MPHHRSSDNQRSHHSAVIENDEEGHLIVRPGDVLQSHYRVLSTLGEGTFGKVFRVRNLLDGSSYALKVIRNVKKYRDAARMEVNVLQKLLRHDPGGKYHIVRLCDWFELHGHMCLTFPVLGMSVYEFLRENDFIPYPQEHVRVIGGQLTSAGAFLHAHSLTHTDLKPENILFKDSSSISCVSGKGRLLVNPDIVLIDFGSATFEDEHHSRVVSTRHYRAPEVILELGWSSPCDAWSLGCILFELASGNTLFQTHNNREHLAIMERILGKISRRMARHSPLSQKYFTPGGVLDWDVRSSAGRLLREENKPLWRSLPSMAWKDCFDLIEKLLVYEPIQRISLAEALRHSFFTSSLDKNRSSKRSGSTSSFSR